MRRIVGEAGILVMLGNMIRILVMWCNCNLAVQRSESRMVLGDSVVWMDDTKVLVDGLLEFGSCIGAAQTMCRRR